MEVIMKKYTDFWLHLQWKMVAVRISFAHMKSLWNGMMYMSRFAYLPVWKMWVLLISKLKGWKSKMVSFEFKRSYGSIEELRADLGNNKEISIWKHFLDVIVSHSEDDDMVIFEIQDDNSLKFSKYEEFSFI